MSLTIGSKAPEIRVAHWVQGQPVTHFEPGRVYVLEFWATWCGPCRSAIPHLSKLAKAHGDRVTIVGVNVFERETQGTPKGIEQIEKFVSSMGANMSYPVCVDTHENFMAEAWMQASGRQGIPASFVVDGEGKIAWIGHPLGGLDGVIQGLLDGTFDAEAGRAAMAEEENRQAEMQRRMRQMQPFFAALKSENYEQAVREVDKLAAEGVHDEHVIRFLKFQAASVCRKQEEAIKIGNAILNDPESKGHLLGIGMVVAELDNPSPDLIRLAIRSIETGMVEDSESTADYRYLFGNALASLYFKLGEKAKAAEIARSAIEDCRKSGSRGAQFLPQLEATLAEFEKP
jgi:thiol-disulfide isomerase/thioredoxin